MVIVYTIDLIVNIDRKGNAIETFVAHATPEAARVIRFAHGLQYLRKAKGDVTLNYNGNLTDNNDSTLVAYHFHDKVAANRALLGCLLETRILRIPNNLYELRELSVISITVISVISIKIAHIPSNPLHSKPCHERCKKLCHGEPFRRNSI